MLTLEQLQQDIEQVRVEIASLTSTCDCIETALAIVARSTAQASDTALETHCTNHIAHTNGVLADRLNDLTTAHVALNDALVEHVTSDSAHTQSSLMSFIRLVNERHTALAQLLANHTKCHHDKKEA